MASKVLDNRTLKPLQPATSLWKQFSPRGPRLKAVQANSNLEEPP